MDLVIIFFFFFYANVVGSTYIVVLWAARAASFSSGADWSVSSVRSNQSVAVRSTPALGSAASRSSTKQPSFDHTTTSAVTSEVASETIIESRPASSNHFSSAS